MTPHITRRTAVLALGATALTSSPAAAQNDALRDRLQTYMDRVSAFGWDGQVVAARGGETLLDAAYGFAERRSRRTMTRTTPIGIASASKQFTAAAILKLAEDGRLTTEAALGDMLPNTPPDKASLTLHQLLTHTAGLAPGDIAGDFEAESKADIVGRVLAAPLELQPGERWAYANAGYNLLAAVVEAVSGETYEDYVDHNLFGPAGLEHTGFPFHRSLRGRPAHAYRAWLDQGSPREWPRANYRPWGGGTAFSTAADLYRWQQALEVGRVLSPASVTRLITPHARSAADGPLDYGYGAFVSTEPRLLVERSGDWERGYNTAWHRWPEQDVTLIITSNSASTTNVSMRQAIQREMEQMLFGETLEAEPPQSAPLSRAQRRALPGVRRLGDAQIEVIDDGAYLWAAAANQAAVERMLLADVPVERRDSYRAATAKTERLLGSMSREAYMQALGARAGEAIEEYWAEWEALIAAHGALQSFAVPGTSRRGQAARTVARLRFADGEVVMVFFWAELGAGDIAGTAVTTGAAPSPFGCVLRRGGEGLLGYDPMSGVSFTMARFDGGT